MDGLSFQPEKVEKEQENLPPKKGWVYTEQMEMNTKEKK